MLETIREYALERLQAIGELPATRDRHAGHFLKVGEEHDAIGRATNDSARFTLLEHDLDNLWQALDWLHSNGRTDDALRLASGLGHFWSVKGHLIEGRRRFAQLLHGAPPSIAHADALNSDAMLAVYTGDVDSAVAQGEEALALHMRLGSRRGVAYAHFVLGQAAGEAAAFERAQSEFEDARRSFLELGDEDLTMAATRLLAWSCYELGDTARCRALHEENLKLARAAGNERIEAETLAALGMAALDEERVDDALALFRDSLHIHSRLDDVADIALDLGRCALARALEGSPVVAAELVGKCEALLNEIGFKRSWITAMNERTLGLVRSQLAGDAADEARERGARLPLPAAVGLALGGPARNPSLD
jgi:tetratricopeptide (TPR) repeat protein